jgi:hypothetical protein
LRGSQVVQESTNEGNEGNEGSDPEFAKKVDTDSYFKEDSPA